MRKLFLLVLMGVATLATGQYAKAADANQISGTIKLFGGQAEPDEIQLHARPVKISVKQREPSEASSGRNLEARVYKTKSGALRFIFPHVKQDTPYALSIRYSGKSYDKIVWRASNGGRAMAGKRRVAIKGFVLRTKVEVLKEGTTVGKPKWVGASQMNFFDEASATRRLRVFSDLPNVKYVVVQISRERFVTKEQLAESACKSNSKQPGLVATKTFRMRGSGWTDLGPINFNSILTSGRTRIGGWTKAILSSRDIRELHSGAPLYVRAIPVERSPKGGLVRQCNPFVAGLPGWAILAYAKPSITIAGNYIPSLVETQDHIYTAAYSPPYFDPAGHPYADEICYEVVKEHKINENILIKDATGNYPWSYFDWWGWVLALNYYANPGDTLPVGWTFCEHKGEDGFAFFFEAFGEFITGTVDMVGWLVTEVAEVFEDIKGAVQGVIVDVVTAVGIPCDEDCSKWIESGIDVGLAAMGLPPSLPNWEEIKDKGINYLATQVAEQAGLGGYANVAAAGLQYAEKAIEKLSQQRSGTNSVAPYADWLSFYTGLKPPVMNFTFSQDGTRPPLVPMDWHFYLYPSRLFRSSENVPLPNEFPWISNTERRLSVPIVLHPNLAKLPPCPGTDFEGVHFDCDEYTNAIWIKNRWADAVNSDTCANFDVGLYIRPEGSGLDTLYATEKEAKHLSNNVYSTISYPEPIPLPYWDLCWVNP
jgi:hypothetical protein